MHKIDVSKWHEFEVGKLFDIHPTRAYKATNAALFDDDGANPVVVNSSYNNGVGGYTNRPATEAGNMITFSDTTTSDAIFYQPVDFVGYPHVQGLYPLGVYADCWNHGSLLFFLTLFKKTAALHGFDYAYKFTREIAAKLKVKLPVSSDGTLDWKLMNSFTQNTMKSAEANLDMLRNIDAGSHKIDITCWKEFRAGELFEIQKGKRLTSANRTSEGTTPYIGALNHDNGVFQYIDQEPIYHGNSITVNYNSSAIGQAYYQERDFWATDDVNVWYFRKENHYSFNKNIALFICAIVCRLGRKFSYTDKWRLEDMQNAKLKLPTTASGKPDWKYIDEHMSNLTDVSAKSIDNLELAI